jgi:hypothetical protein
MDALTSDVFASPAIGILCDLELDGFRVELLSDGAISNAPRSRLTPERMQAIAAYKDALRLLLRCYDAGVAERRDAFRFLIDAAKPGILPALVFKSNLAYVKGVCFSCGDGLAAARFGRCWRCSLASRLACRLPLSAEVAAALDSARVA